MTRLIVLLIGAFSPAVLLAQQIVWHPPFSTTIASGATYSVAASLSNGPSSTITLYKGANFFAQGVGGAGAATADVGPTTIIYTAVAAGYANTTLYITILAPVPQAAVSSANASLPFGSAFTPAYSGGSGAGNWQFLVGGYTNIPGDGGRFEGGAGTILEPQGVLSPSWSPPGIGSYNFIIRKFGDAAYQMSSWSNWYTLTVVTASQPAVASANQFRYVGESFTPAYSGGAGTGAWQFVVGGNTNWPGDNNLFTGQSGTLIGTTLSPNWTPTAAGTYSFWIRRVGDANYYDSGAAGPYTLTVGSNPTGSIQILNGSQNVIGLDGNGRAPLPLNSSFYIRVNGGDADGNLQRLYSRINRADGSPFSYPDVAASGSSASYNFGPYTADQVGVWDVWGHIQDSTQTGYQWIGGGWYGMHTPDIDVYNQAPAVAMSGNSTVSAIGQVLTLTLSGSDPNANLRAVNLWVLTPNTGWRNIRSDSSLSSGAVENTTTDNAISSGGSDVASLGAVNRTFTFPLDQGFGVYQFHARAIDAFSSTSGTAIVNVTVANRAPVANGQAVNVTEDVAKVVTLSGSDPDGQSISFAITGNPTNGTLAGSGAVRTYTPTANFNGSDSFSFRVNDGSLDSPVATVSIAVAAVNDPPAITTIATQTINEDSSTGSLAFTISDVDTAVTSLTVSGSSSNTAIVPNGNIVFGGSGANRTVTVTPAGNQNGSVNITLGVSDGALTTTTMFTLNILAVNDVPTITTIATQMITQDSSTGALAFTVGDLETAAGSLTLSGSSSNTTLVPNGNIVFGGSGANRTVTVTPAANQSGTATITIGVSDGAATTSTNFTINVVAVTIFDKWTLPSAPVTGSPFPLRWSGISNGNAVYMWALPQGGSTWINLGSMGGGAGALKTINASYSFPSTGTWTLKITEGAETLPQIDTITLLIKSPNDTSAPTIPTGLAVSGVSYRSFTLTWLPAIDNIRVTQYEVMRDSTSVGVVADTSLLVTNLDGPITYQMKVRAGDANDNWSAWSGALAVTTLNPYGDDDGDGMANEWEVLNGLNPANAGDKLGNPDNDGFLNVEEYNLWQNPNVYNPPGAIDFDATTFARVQVTAKGNGTVSVTYQGNATNFVFQTSDPNNWTAPDIVNGGGMPVYLLNGVDYPMTVSSTGVTDFIVKITPDATKPALERRISINDNFVDGITKQEAAAAGGAMKVRSLPRASLAFAALDMGRFDTARVLTFGLGVNSAGQSNGAILFNFGPYQNSVTTRPRLTVHAGPGLDLSGAGNTNFIETPTRTQVAVPGGYVDVAIKRWQFNVTYFAANTSFTWVDGFRDFGQAAPLSAYQLDVTEPGDVYPSLEPQQVWQRARVITLQRANGGDVRKYTVRTDWYYYEVNGTWMAPPPGSPDPVEQLQVDKYYRTSVRSWPWSDVAAPLPPLIEVTYSANQNVKYIGTAPTPGLMSNNRLTKARYAGSVRTTVPLSYADTIYAQGDGALARAPLGVTLGSPLAGDQSYQGGSYDGATLNSKYGAMFTSATGNQRFTEDLHFTSINNPSNLGSQPQIAVGNPKETRTSFLDNAVGTSTDLVTAYTYDPNLQDGKVLPASVITTQNGTEIGRSTYAYANGTLNGVATLQTTVTVSSKSGTTLQTITKAYSAKAADTAFRGRPVSVTRPAGSKSSYAYQRGNLVGATWTADANGTFVLTAELTGKTGSGVSAYLGVSVDPLDLEANKSVVAQTIVNADGRVVREASYVYTGGTTFSPVTAVYYGYDALGNLTMKADQPIVPGGPQTGRVLYEAAYTAYRKNWEKDEQGIKLTYHYDSYDRADWVTREAAGVSTDPGYVAEMKTSYVYDGAGRVTQQTVSSPGESETLVTNYTYDTANRPKDVIAPGGFIKSTTYDSATQVTVRSKTNDATPVVVNAATTVVWKDGRKKSVSGDAVPDSSCTYYYDVSGFLVATETHATGGGYTRTVTDWLGRVDHVDSPTFSGGTLTDSRTYNSAGQLVAEDSKSGSTKLLPAHLYAYDSYGRLLREATDSNNNGSIDLGIDGDVKEYEFAYQQKQVNRFNTGVPVHTTQEWYRFDGVKVYPYAADLEGGTDRSSEWRYASESYAQLSGLTSTLAGHSYGVDFDRNKTQTIATLDRANKVVTSETNTTGSSQLVRSITRAGLTVSSQNAQGQVSRQSYDGLGRLIAVEDSRISALVPASGWTDYTYVPNTAMQQAVSTTDNKITTFAYDSAGRVSLQTDPAGKTTRYAYDAMGHVVHTWGDTPNPVWNEYDELGRQVKLHTYRAGTWNSATVPTGFAGAGDVTTWNYAPVTGVLLSKVDAANRTTSYLYDDLSRVSQRTDARGWVTTFGYFSQSDAASGQFNGALKQVHYPNGLTPDVSYTYHRTGKTRTVSDAAGVRTFNYYESWTDNTYDNQLRDKSGALQSESLTNFLGAGNGYTQTYDYQYTVASRANGPLASVQFGSATIYKINYAYDDRLRIASVGFLSDSPFTYSYVANSNLPDIIRQGSSSSYTYQRDYDYETTSDRLAKIVHRSRSGSSGNANEVETRLTYNNLGLRQTEKTKGTNFTNLLTRPVNGVHIDYTYTDRYESDVSAKYGMNTSWGVPGGATALANTGRNYDYDPIGNRTADQTGPYSMKEYSTPQGMQSANEYLNTPYGSNLTYDANGNLLTDGIRTCTYDGENRLVTVTQSGATYIYKYDYLGRRISKSGGGLAETRYVYDGWNPIAELNSANALLRRFVWGPDVSGTGQGAGGVGGLLTIALSSGTTRYLPIYDASRNVVGLYNQSGAIAAAYEYDPFGNILLQFGSYSSSNPFRFSTKFTDQETALVYYGMRFYSPLLGRFLNRDPIAEAGGLNLYGFCGNDGVNRYDYLGMEWWNPFSWFGGGGDNKDNPPPPPADDPTADPVNKEPIVLTPFEVTAKKGDDTNTSTSGWDAVQRYQTEQSQRERREEIPCIRCHGVDGRGFHGDVTDFQGAIGMDPRLATYETRAITVIGPKVGIIATTMVVSIPIGGGAGGFLLRAPTLMRVGGVAFEGSSSLTALSTVSGAGQANMLLMSTVTNAGGQGVRLIAVRALQAGAVYQGVMGTGGFVTGLVTPFDPTATISRNPITVGFETGNFAGGTAKTAIDELVDYIRGLDQQ